MNHSEGSFLGLYDTKIYYQSWIPSEPKAVLLVIHGFGEHSGRYMNVVDTVVPEGIAVYALDHRGHGKSEGKENYVKKFTDFTSDVGSLEEIARKAHPNLPLFVLGHSMGSLIATQFMTNHANQSDVAGLILSGTGGSFGPEINGVTIFLAKVLGAIAPKLSIPSNLDPNFISHDQEVIDAYVNDPLVHYEKITTKLAKEMMGATKDMIPAASSINLPVLIQIGTEDDTFSMKQEFADAFPHDDSTFHHYEGFRHEVYNEEKKEIPLNHLKDWIINHL